jgi:hypothetical protein
MVFGVFLPSIGWKGWDDMGRMDDDYALYPPVAHALAL